MNTELKNKLLACTVGSQFGAILRCAMNVERGAEPRFNGKATVTSDGFVMCNFVDSRGDHHWGAFVGSKQDLWGNVLGISNHLKLTKPEIAELTTLVDAWLGLEIIRVTSVPKRKHVLPGEMGGLG